MHRFPIRLASIEQVKEFVHIVSDFDFDVDLSSGRYVVDAKSIMGVLSLDLSRPVDVELRGTRIDDLVRALDAFRV